jgi:TetR/AcrR family transcriptional regulator, mexCD-oprJ operon repressor
VPASIPDADPALTDHRRATADRNADAILEAAAELLERRSAVSIAAVAARARLSRVTVYAHFPDRQALLEAVVGRAVEQTVAIVEAAKPSEGRPPDALRRFVSEAWAQLDRHGAIAQAAADHLSPEAMRRAHAGAHDHLARLIERGRRDGSFRTDLPTEWIVTAVLALFHACGDYVRAGRIEAAEAPRLLTATIATLVGASDMGSG